VYVVSNLILTACFVLNISIIPLRHSNLPSQFHHQLHFTSLYTNLANIRRLDDLEKAPIPEGYEEFASTGASSSTIQLRPIQRDENGLLIRPDATPQQSGITITMYTNGFTVNHGRFRPIPDPTNELFLEQIKAGDVPAELEPLVKNTNAATAEQIAIKIENKDEEWKDPNAPAQRGYDFNQGRGQTLLTEPLHRDGQLSQLPPSTYTLPPDEQQPPMVVQIVLLNRQRIRLQVSPNTTIAQIYQHVNTLSPVGTDEIYILQGGFPQREFTDGTKTVGELKLNNQALTQKKK